MRDIAQAYRTDERYVPRVITLAFLPAQITRDILAGTQPLEMTPHDLLLGEAFSSDARHQYRASSGRFLFSAS